MSYAGLLNQVVSLSTKSGYDGEGRETFSATSSISARFQKMVKRKLLPNGSVITIDAIVYIPASTTVASDDKITYNSDVYKVVGIYEAVDGEGNVHNIKLELVKWQ